MPPYLKTLVDLAPLGAFVIGFYLLGIQGATVVLMVATFISLAVTWVYERKLALMPLVAGVMVGVFGAFTLILQDETFIKMKPTVVNLLFATILIGGALLKKPLLRYVLDVALHLTEKGWMGLTWRWGVFFIFLAVVNEVVWRNFSTEFWVNFKLFGMFTLNVAFWVAHAPFIMKHRVAKADN